MRLTLRTLLAYLDDMLEPSDAQEIGKKIEESEFASQLVHRIQDVMRRLRIGAPKVQGRGLGVDPNSVAEYLEDTLPPERVLEFEKVCLESDVHLAEVASCHQILTLVLGEPAEVDASMRERMYGLTAGKEVLRRAEREGSLPAEEPDGAPVVATLVTVGPGLEEPRRVLEVPDYLRQSRRKQPMSVWPVAAAVLLLGILAGGAAVLFAPWDRVRQGLLGEGALAARDDEPMPPEPVDDLADESMAVESDPARELADESVATEAEEMLDAALDEEQVVTTEAAEVLDAAGGTVSAEGENELERPPVDSLAGPDAVVADADEAAVAPLPGVADGRIPGDEELADTGNDAPTDVAAPLSGMGRVSNQGLLLGWDHNRKVWDRLPQQVIYPGDALITLPMSRSVLNLGAGIMLHMLGPTELQLEAPDASAVPGIVVPQGRVLLMTVGQPGVRLRVRSGTSSGTLIFGDAETTVALEVKVFRPAGSDPELEGPREQVTLCADRGNAVWRADDGQEQALVSPMVCRIDPAGHVAQAVEGELVDWINSAPSSLEKKAVDYLSEVLNQQGGRSVSLTLKEIHSKSQRPEIRSLAAISLGQLDDFSALVEGLNDARLRSFWPQQIEALRDGLARGEVSAKRLLLTLEELRGADDGPEIFRLLRGYSADELQNGGDAQLVAFLDHDDLDLRVLAWWNLQQITGHTYYYRPEDPPSKRQPQIIKWRQKLEAGQIAPNGSAP
jgi:hypothetical protein